MMDELMLVAPATRCGAQAGTVVDGMAETMEAAPGSDELRRRARSSGAVHAAAAQFTPWLRSDA